MELPDVTARLLRYIDTSPSPYHAAALAEALLVDAGFRALAEGDPWPAAAGGHVVRRGGALVAWVIPDGDARSAPFRVVGAHTDSPNLRIKSRPDTGRAGYRQLGVEVYGGVLLNSWLDRDLGLSGRLVVDDDGTRRTVLFDVGRPLMRMAQLAIHLDRDVNQGLKLDPQQHLSPIWALGEPTDGELVEFLAAEAGVGPGQVLAFEAMTHDLTPARTLGRDDEMYAAGRIDNLASCHAAVEALTAAEDGDAIAVIVLFDHEEIGSDSSSGAGSPLLADTLERISLTVGRDRDGHLRALRDTVCISADGAHAVHPNYPDRHEPDHHVHLNGGPVVKRNANVRYASDAQTVAHVVAVARDAGVDLQQYIHRTDLPCGSTIGPITAANVGIGVVDVGSAQLSMHSARELAGTADPPQLTSLLAAFLAQA